MRGARACILSGPIKKVSGNYMAIGEVRKAFMHVYLYIVLKLGGRLSCWSCALQARVAGGYGLKLVSSWRC